MTTPPKLPARILVGIDLDGDPFETSFGPVPFNGRLVEQAVWLAQLARAEVRFVHSVEGFGDALTAQEQKALATVRSAASRALGALVDRVNAMNVRADAVVEIGSATQAMLRAADEWNADLLMVAGRSRPDPMIERILFGSTTKKLFRKSALPVWAVNPNVAPGFRTIGTLVDLQNDFSRKLVATADVLAEATGAEKSLLHCVDYPGDIALRRLPDPEPEVAAYHLEVRTNASRKIDDLLGAHRAAWHVFLVDGHVSHVLSDFVHQKALELVVMGSVARTGIPGLLIGNTAEKVFENLEASVWVIKPDGWKGV